LVEVLFLAVQEFHFLVYSEPDGIDCSLLVLWFLSILSSIQLTQYDMLPQHQVNIRKLISECFKKCDFSKEHCISLKMILGSKHVGAILNVLSKKFYVFALVGM